MKPQEQIIQASIEFSRNSKARRIRCRNFEKGAEYGYNLAIENVLEWLKKDLIETKDRDGHPSIESRSCRTVDEFINDIKQAMEGE